MKYNPNFDKFNILTIIIFSYSLIALQWNWANVGNDQTPRIYFSWAMLILGAGWCWSQALYIGKIYFHSLFFLLVLPPLVVAGFSIFGLIGTKEYYPMLSFSALIFAALWVVGLIQLNLNERQWEIIGWLVTVGTALLSVIALISPPYLNIRKFFVLLPSPMTIIHGGFQQPNLFSSYIGTVIIFQYWLVLRNPIKSSNLKFIILMAVSAILAITLFLTASRTGFLGLFVGLVLMTVWVFSEQKNNIKKHFLYLSTIFLAYALATYLANHFTPDKVLIQRVQGTLAGQGIVSRANMWFVSFHIWLDHFWFGVGLDRFTEFYTDYYVSFVSQIKNPFYEINLDHPHNEVLLWLLETGLVGCCFVMLPWVSLVLYPQIKSPISTLGWFACLIPISIHCMLEFPLHSSGAHWFLLCLVIAAGYDQLQLRSISFEWSLSFKRVLSITVVAGFTIPFLIMIQTGYTSKLILEHMFYTKESYQDHLVEWSKSPEFNHPILGRLSNDLFLHDSIALIVQSGDSHLIKTWCPLIENYALRWQNPYVWKALGFCYIQNSNLEKFENLILKLDILEPSLSKSLKSVERSENSK